MLIYFDYYIQKIAVFMLVVAFYFVVFICHILSDFKLVCGAKKIGDCFIMNYFKLSGVTVIVDILLQLTLGHKA